MTQGNEDGKLRSSHEERLTDGWEGFTEDGNSLDAMARGLASGALSRRQALKMGGVALLGGALGIFGWTGSAEANNGKRRRKRKRPNARPCPNGPSDCLGNQCCLTLPSGSKVCGPASFCPEQNPNSGSAGVTCVCP